MTEQPKPATDVMVDMDCEGLCNGKVFEAEQDPGCVLHCDETSEAMEDWCVVCIARACIDAEQARADAAEEKLRKLESLPDSDKKTLSTPSLGGPGNDSRRMTMRPHEERVVAEKAALDEKAQLLQEFILNNPLYEGLPKEERDRLQRQLVVMAQYSEILAERIDAFPPDDDGE